MCAFPSAIRLFLQTPHRFLTLLATGLVSTSAIAQTPNVELPTGVVAPEGQLSLFADYAAREADGVPLYVVNRTKETVTFDSQDGNIFVMLEHRLPDGTWERAEPHASSWCGNSYYPITLPPGQYFKFHGFAPTSGEKSHVRYAGYGGLKLFSNDGEGLALPAAIAEAQRDHLGRQISPTIDRQLDSQYLEYLHSSPESVVAALRLLRVSGANPYYQESATALAKNWGNKPNPSEKEQTAARAIREVLAEPWPEKRDRNALFDRCLEALRLPDAHKGQFGAIETDPLLVWSVLKDLAAEEGFRGPSKWKPLVDFCLVHPTPQNIQNLVDLATFPYIGDELLPDRFFETHIFDSPDGGPCASILARRGRFSELIAIGWKMQPKGQLTILQALAVTPNQSPGLGRRMIRQPGSDEERLYWDYCLKTQPLEAAYVLQNLTFNSFAGSETNPFGGFVQQRLRDYLTTEIETASKKPDDFSLGENGYKLRILVDFMASSNAKDDTPLLEKLLTFKGYEEGGVRVYDNDKRARILQFGVRAAARAALEKRGRRIPEGIVFEKELPLPADSPERIKSG
ncbi:MAG TPA: hypothetical protein VIM61_03580 [Chthoniobacterales bacterium]